MSTVLLDDHVLLRVLLDDEPPALRPTGATVATTGLWYHRLCRALADTAVIGSMSRRLGAVEAAVAAEVLGAVIELPDTIELVSLRTLGWPMGELVHAGAQLNLLSLEALAAARHLAADICLADVDDNATLRAAATKFGVSVRTVRADHRDHHRPRPTTSARGGLRGDRRPSSERHARRVGVTTVATPLLLPLRPQARSARPPGSSDHGPVPLPEPSRSTTSSRARPFRVILGSEHVEVGLPGRRAGRTGTALACLAVLTGTPPGEAVAWICAAYCEKARRERRTACVVVAAFPQGTRQRPIDPGGPDHGSRLDHVPLDVRQAQPAIGGRPRPGFGDGSAWAPPRSWPARLIASRDRARFVQSRSWLP